MIYYADFAKEHRHPTTGESMEGFYVKLDAEDDESARFMMFDLFLGDFKFLYGPQDNFSPSSCPKGLYATGVAKPFNPKPGIIT